MKIYSFQPILIVQKILKNGIVYSKKDMVFPPQEIKLASFFQSAYDWMNQKLKEKIVKPKQADYPFWGYFQWSGVQHTKPDLRSSEAHQYCKKQPYCLLTLEIPEIEILLSDYDAWHFVLNRWYFTSNSLREMKEQELNQQGFSLYRQEQLPKETLDLIQSSWNHIFDLKQSAIFLETSIKQTTIQANFWSISKEYLQTIVLFDGKSKKQSFNKKNFHVFQKNYIGDSYVTHD
jgi:hypothetical protein